MISHITADFRRDFSQLPPTIQKLARDAFRIFLADPSHPSLRFKKLPPHADLWSVIITAHYRAIDRRKADIIFWFFIGSHADYDKILERL